MRYGILGPLEVSAGAGGAAVPSGAKARALLAILLLHANEAVSADRLALAMWGDDAPHGSVKALQVHVSRLRRALGDGAVIETTPGGYCLRVEPGELDVERFDELVEGGRQALADGDAQRAAVLLREGLGVWRGPALSDLAQESFATSEIRQLEERRLAASELAIDCDLAAGRHREVIGEIGALVAEHPLRERLHAQRMLALYRCGRQAEALEAYREARQLLVDEIGVEPGAELRALHEAILRQDPSLDLVRTELPRQLQAAVRQPMVGRERELTWLWTRWERVRAGPGELVAVIGPLGIGRTRLVAAFAADVQREGAAVSYVDGWQRVDDVVAATRRVADAQRPMLLVVDDVDADPSAVAALGALDLASTRALVVATTQDAGDLTAAAGLVLEPLDAESVRRIAELYAAERDLPGADLLAASGGIPRRVHEVASERARQQAARRVVAAAPRAAADRDELRAAEAELAGGVVDFQAARERAQLLDEPEGPGVCPFKGLASFDVADARFFFGRERLIAELMARAVGAPLLGVVGPSGSGKSSVVRAGLLPALASGVLPGSDSWPQVLMRPGEHPLAELRAAMIDIAGDERIVLAIDQFEEVFTACRDERERNAFIDAIVHVASRRRGSTVVLAVRADFYGRCAGHRALSALLGAGNVLVGPMQRDELCRAIELPAERAGLEVEPELVDALLDDVGDEPGALPLLSTALLELWQARDGRRLRHATYERTGGVRGAVARLAEQAYGELEPAQQRTARRMLLRLAGEGPDGTVVRRRIALTELEGYGDDDVTRVLDVLADRRLVTVSASSVEVAHEALLREWPRLRGWLEDDAQGRSIHRHLADAAREWDARGRDPGDVYRGARLAAALEWRAGHEEDLNTAERDFLDAGRDISGRAQRRLRLVLAGVAALLVAAVLGGVVALHQRSTARSEARTAQAQRLGTQALTEGDLARSLLLAREGVALDDSVATRSNLLAALLRAPAAMRVIRGDGSPLQAIAVAPGNRTLVAGDIDGSVFFRDAASGRPIGPPYEASDRAVATALAFSPDGRRFAVAGGGDFIDIVDARTHKRITDLFTVPNHEAFTLRGVTFSPPDGRVLAASYFAHVGRPTPGSYNPPPRTATFLQLWDSRTGTMLGRPRPIGPGHAAPVGFVAGGRRLVVSGRAGTTIFDRRTLRPVRHWLAGGAPAAMSPDQKVLAFGAPDGSVRLLELGSGKVRAAVRRHHAAVTVLRFTPDSRRLVTAAVDGTVITWDVRSAAPIDTLESESAGAAALAIAGDGRTAYSANQDGSIVAWDLTGTRRLARAFRTPPMLSNFGSVVATRDGAGFAVPDGTGYVDVFNARTLARTTRIRVGSVPVAAVAMMPDGRTLAAAREDGRVAFADVRSGQLLRRPFLVHTGLTARVAVSRDGRWLAVAGGDPGVDIWDDSEQRFENTLTLGDDVFDVSMSPAADTLVAAVGRPGRGELDVVALPGLRILHRVPAPPGYVARFSSDGRLLLYGDIVGRTWIFDTRTWRHGAPLVGNSLGVASVDLSPDRRTLAASSFDGTTRLWDLASGRAIGTPLPGLPVQRASAAFVDGGTHLVTVSDDGHGYLWDLRPQAWERRACAVAGRALTRAEWQDVLPERGYAPACAQR
jgi:DNA-binding SARP family transcriptional activator/WD40 repeat protein